MDRSEDLEGHNGMHLIDLDHWFETISWTLQMHTPCRVRRIMNLHTPISELDPTCNRLVISIDLSFSGLIGISFADDRFRFSSWGGLSRFIVQDRWWGHHVVVEMCPAVWDYYSHTFCSSRNQDYVCAKKVLAIYKSVRFGEHIGN